MPTTPNDKIINSALDDPRYCGFMDDFNYINWNSGIQGVHSGHPWRVDKVFTTDDPEARLNKTGSGVYYTRLGATAEVINTTLFWGDQLGITMAGGPVVIFRIKAPTFTQNGDALTFGLASENVPNIDNITNSIWVQYLFAGGFPTGMSIASDDGTTDIPTIDSGMPWLNNTYREFMIDCSVVTDCKFWFRTTLGGAWSSIPSPAIHTMTAAIYTQPFIRLAKGATASTPSLICDFVKVFWKRL